MIIDQSPSAVDEAAIKNTAIKIAMRLPYKDDREEMGASLGLNENQIVELSRLDIGVAAIFHVGWTDTVLAKMGEIWNKRYRQKTPPVLDPGTYTKLQGAIVQQIYNNLDNGDCTSIHDDVQDLINTLCKGPLALRPVLPLTKQKELMEEVDVFLQNQELLIRHNEINKLKKEFFRFAFEFLQLGSVMRVCELKGVEGKLLMIGDAPSKSDIRKYMDWETNLRPAVCRYLYMPEFCEPPSAYRWLPDASKAEYFWEIYEGLLWVYTWNFAKDFRYDNALDYLSSIRYFSGKSGGRT